MDIVVLIKQVPNTVEIKIDPATKNLIRDGVPSIINPEDKNALEEALKIKEKFGGKVTVVTMGPAQAEEALREALAMGADEAVLLSDRFFAGADTYATAKTLSAFVKTIKYDLILCGRQAIDGDTAQVGPQVADKLGIPQVTYVKHIEIDGDTVTVKRALEDGYELIKVKMPVLLTVTKELNTPRYPSIRGIFEAYEKTIRVVTAQDLGLNPEEIGLKGSPTRVVTIVTPEHQRKTEILTGGTKEVVNRLTERILLALK